MAAVEVQIGACRQVLALRDCDEMDKTRRFAYSAAVRQRALQNILRRTDSGRPEDFNNRVWMPGKSQEEK